MPVRKTTLSYSEKRKRWELWSQGELVATAKWDEIPDAEAAERFKERHVPAD